MADDTSTRNGRLKKSNKTNNTASEGRKLVVSIGIDAYKQMTPLHNAVNDARSVQRLFVEKLGYNAPFDALENGRATGVAINTLLLEKLRQTLEPDDTLVLFFAGHGAVRADERGGSVGFLVPVDAGPEEWSRFLRIDTLLDEIGRLPALHILVIIDTCFSGFALGGTFARQVKAGATGRPSSRRVITSARAFQLAQDGSFQQANSPFTAVLLDAFSPQENDLARADFDQNGAIIGIELGLFVQLEFGRTSHYEQMPDFGTFHHDERGEFVVATRGTAQKPDNPELIAILLDAQGWLKNKGDRAFLYRGGQLAAAQTWRKQQRDADVRDEVDTFLNASRHWQRLRRLAAVGVALIIIAMLYLLGDALYKRQLKANAEAETAVFSTATIRLGIDAIPWLVEGFKLDKHEVSVGQYHLCFRAGACTEPAGIPDFADFDSSGEGKDLPIVSVSMFNARDYCAWQNGRLPTVAEWEYAVRGTEYRTWPWGEDDPTYERVNMFLPNSPDMNPSIDVLVNVDSKDYEAGRTPDKHIWHLLGNAREWTSTLDLEDCVTAYQCDMWDGNNSVVSVLTAGFSYQEELAPDNKQIVSIFKGATEEDIDIGFRCAYE